MQTWLPQSMPCCLAGSIRPTSLWIRISSPFSLFLLSLHPLMNSGINLFYKVVTASPMRSQFLSHTRLGPTTGSLLLWMCPGTASVSHQPGEGINHMELKSSFATMAGQLRNSGSPCPESEAYRTSFHLPSESPTWLKVLSTIKFCTP